jgi:hypothetical protein
MLNASACYVNLHEVAFQDSLTTTQQKERRAKWNVSCLAIKNKASQVV